MGCQLALAICSILANSNTANRVAQFGKHRPKSCIVVGNSVSLGYSGALTALLNVSCTVGHAPFSGDGGACEPHRFKYTSRPTVARRPTCRSRTEQHGRWPLRPCKTTAGAYPRGAESASVATVFTVVYSSVQLAEGAAMWELSMSVPAYCVYATSN